jgi:hypothetical protein
MEYESIDDSTVAHKSIVAVPDEGLLRLEKALKEQFPENKVASGYFVVYNPGDPFFGMEQRYNNISTLVIAMLNGEKIDFSRLKAEERIGVIYAAEVRDEDFLYLTGVKKVFRLEDMQK